MTAPAALATDEMPPTPDLGRAELKQAIFDAHASMNLVLNKANRYIELHGGRRESLAEVDEVARYVEMLPLVGSHLRNDPTSITGRDGYIVGQALVYAVAYIQSVPREMREWSNMADMLTIAKATRSPAFIEFHRQNVFNQTGAMIDMDPDPERDLRDDDEHEGLDEAAERAGELVGSREGEPF